MTAYHNAHRAVERKYGKAKAHSCAHCGQPAREWALVVEGARGPLDLDLTGLFSENVGDYAPLCLQCHRALDAAQLWTEAKVAAVAANAPLGGAAFARRYAEDPEFAAERREHLAGIASLGGKTGGSKGGTTRAAQHARQLREDPAYAAWWRSVCTKAGSLGGHATSTKRRACSECGRVSTPGGIGAHQKHTGHSGWTVVKEQS